MGRSSKVVQAPIRISGPSCVLVPIDGGRCVAGLVSFVFFAVTHSGACIVEGGRGILGLLWGGVDKIRNDSKISLALGHPGENFPWPTAEPPMQNTLPAPGHGSDLDLCLNPVWLMEKYLRCGCPGWHPQMRLSFLPLPLPRVKGVNKHPPSWLKLFAIIDDSNPQKYQGNLNPSWNLSEPYYPRLL